MDTAMNGPKVSKTMLLLCQSHYWKLKYGDKTAIVKSVKSKFNIQLKGGSKEDECKDVAAIMFCFKHGCWNLGEHRDPFTASRHWRPVWFPPTARDHWLYLHRLLLLEGLACHIWSGTLKLPVMFSCINCKTLQTTQTNLARGDNILVNNLVFLWYVQWNMLYMFLL